MFMILLIFLLVPVKLIHFCIIHYRQVIEQLAQENQLLVWKVSELEVYTITCFTVVA